MASLANELLAAVHQRLAGDAPLSALIRGAAIHDRRLTRPDVPYLLVGSLEERDYSTDGAVASEIFLTLEAWSGEGRRQAGEIAGQVRALLHRADLVLATRTLVDLQHRGTVSRREPKTGLFVAEMRFRAVVE
ncbi:MAG: DUF3168 domain-containing protein [Allorhizobium sp.]